MSEIAWCSNLFAMIEDGGKWAVPRTGLIFRKDGTALILQEFLPGFDRGEQEAEFQCIKEHFADAGIPVRKE